MKTRETTVVAFLAELMEAHTEKCDAPLVGTVPHIISEDRDTKADIESLSTVSNMITLQLSDGAEFVITVQRSLR